MTAAPQERKAPAARPGRRGILSRLTLRILAINLFAVAILFVGVLYLDRYQNSLIRAELEAIDRQGRVFAQAVGELAIPSALGGPSRLSPPALRRLVRRLAPALDMRVRIFAPGGRLLVDSAVLPGPGGFIRMHPLPPPRDGGVVAQMLFDMARRMADWLPRRGDMPPYRERAEQWADDYLEVRLALAGETAQQVRLTSDGTLLLSVAVPVQSYKEVLGALMLSTEGTDIDAAVRDVRLEILGVFAIVFTITVLLSLYLAGTIIRPVQRLARAAEDVRTGGRRRGEIPNLAARGDEIGDLSMALRDMTEALRDRVDAIERFAADVAHEIKNPLTSLRSAVETAARIEDPGQRAKLMAIILDDVQRVDRLISDISDASRLDAELSRADFAAVDLAAMAATVRDVYGVAGLDHDRQVVCAAEGPEAAWVRGDENRLVQVLRNLITNAISFSPVGGVITLTLMADPDQITLAVEDAGPGIPAGKLDNVFERFYSERPAGEKFGTHSGLGLSISKQIIEAHGGRIWAENRVDAEGRVTGARFVFRLPRAAPGEARQNDG